MTSSSVENHIISVSLARMVAQGLGWEDEDGFNVHSLRLRSTKFYQPVASQTVCSCIQSQMLLLILSVVKDGNW